MRKIIYFLIFIGIFISIGSPILSAGILKNLDYMNGTNSMNKVVLSSKNNASRRLITVDDISELKKQLKTEEIAYSSFVDGVILYKDRYKEARIVGVNSKYKEFTNTNIKYGTFFSTKIDEEYSRIAVISSELAWDIFGRQDVVGMSVYILDRRFKVIGVYDKQGFLDKTNNANENVLEYMTDNGLSEVMIPINTLIDINNNNRIEHLQIKLPNNSILGVGKEFVSQGFRSIGKNPNEYEITDFQRENKLILQNHLIVVFILGILSIFITLKFLANELKKDFIGFKELLLKYYIKDIFKTSYLTIIFVIIKVLVCAIIVFAVWKIISFNMYVPPEYIPNELIDVQFYKDLIIDIIQEKNINIGNMPDKSVLQLIKAKSLTQILMISGILLGILPLFLGIKLLIENKVIPIVKAFAFIIVATIISIFIIYIISFYFGIETQFYYKSIIVLWCFTICMTGNSLLKVDKY